MELSANFCLVKLGFTKFANTSSRLATVGMIVQDLSVSIRRTAWAVWESNRDGKAPKEWLSVRELGRLKEDSFFVIDFSDCLMCPH